MSSLATMLPGAAMTYLVNLAVAVSLACGVGLLAARLCRRGSAPLQHGVLAWTLLLMLISPSAVWVAQVNGLALVRITVSERADTRAAAPTKGLPSPGTDRRLVGTGAGDEGRDGDELRDCQEQSLGNSPHPNPLPEGEGTVRRNDVFHAAGARAVPSSENSSSVGKLKVVRPENPAPAWWRLTASAMAVVWAAGILVGLVRLAWGYLMLAQFCRRLVPLVDPRQKLLVHQAADAVRLRKLPTVFLSPSTGVPVSIGLMRPAIVLPATMPPEADEEQLQAVLLHEMAHIARRDHWVGVGQRLATVLFWWNPLVHRICKDISEVREEICDNHVVLVQGEGRRLARILVDLAARATATPLLPSTIGVLEPKLAGLTGRVMRLLNKERNMETRMNLAAKMSVVVCALALLLGMATVGGLRVAYAEPAAAPVVPAAAEKKPAAPTGSVTDLWQAAVERLSHRLALGGRVVDPDGKPLAGAKIYLLANRDELSYASPAEILPAKLRRIGSGRPLRLHDGGVGIRRPVALWGNARRAGRRVWARRRVRLGLRAGRHPQEFPGGCQRRHVCRVSGRARAASGPR